MTTVPEQRDEREVELGTVGALLRFIERYEMAPETPIKVYDSRVEADVPLGYLEFQITDGGVAALVFNP